MKKKCLLWLTFSLLFCAAPAQRTYIEVHLTTNEFLDKISLTPLGMRSGNPLQKSIISFTKVSPTLYFTYATILHAGLYRLGDGYKGHIIFLSTDPDSITIRLTPIKNLKEQLARKVYFSKFHNMQVTARHIGNLTFFDELEKKTGPVIKYENYPGITPVAFKRKCDEAFNKATDLLKTYIDKKIVSSDFLTYAEAEIQSDYVLRICTIFSEVPQKNIPVSYLEKVKNWQFTRDSLAFYTDDYITAANLYNIYVYNDYDLEWKNEDFLKNYSTAQKNFSGAIRERLQAWLLSDFVEKQLPEFDSVCQVFMQTTSSSSLKNEVTKRIAAWKAKQAELNKLSWQLVKDSTILRNNGSKIFTLKEVFTGKPLVLIDTWASWCVPCRKEIPYLEAFRKKYNKELRVLYFSIDDDLKAWQKGIRQNYLSNDLLKEHFILENGDKNIFSKYFDIAFIPRYILVSGDGNTVLEKEMPLPSKQETFESILQKHL